MDPNAAALKTYSPKIGLKKRPIRHGGYVHSQNALRVRANKVRTLVNRAAAAMPWLRDEHWPLLRQWCELEEIRRAVFAGISQLQGSGVIRIDEKQREVSVRRLVHDHRQIVQTQLLVQRELLMSPAAHAAVSHDQPFDLIGAMAQAASAEPVEEPVEGAEPPESDS